ncbi:hypothetical protein BJV78DRAFT_16995 [Lactifluus subvellereus]|nr:hypothetical protein BJV78DRAFT_16995 [Lactifluus subvellereus]
MDNFINLAKQGYEAYQSSQGQGQGQGQGHGQGQSHGQGGDGSDYRRTGGEEYNSPHHSQQGSGGYGGPQCKLYCRRLSQPPWPLINASSWLLCADDHDEVVNTAQTHGSGDSSMFSSAMSYVQQNHVRRSP